MIYLFKSIVILTFIVTGTLVNAQTEYKIQQTTGSINLVDVNLLEVIGYDGNEIILLSDEDFDDDEDRAQRARGLKRMNTKGLEDNSGLGLSVDRRGNDLFVESTQNAYDDVEYRIKIPKGVAVYIENSSSNVEDISLSDLENEIIISTNYSSVDMFNVTGPMSVKTVYGDLEVHINEARQESPISLHSVYGFVDVTLAENTKADLDLQTLYGEIFSDLNIKIEKTNTNTTKNECGSIFGVDALGTLNGGGTDITITANYDDIYLRKSK